MSFLDYIAQTDPWIILIISLIFIFVDLIILDTQILLWFGIATIFVAVENLLKLEQPVQIITFIIVSLILTIQQHIFNPRKQKITIDDHPDQHNSVIDQSHYLGKIGTITKIKTIPQESITQIGAKDYVPPIFKTNSISEIQNDEIFTYVSLDDGNEWECETNEKFELGDKVKIIARNNGRMKVIKI